MTKPAQKELLSEIEINSLSKIYQEWRERRRQNKFSTALLFTPINVNAHEIVEEMRFLQNSPLRFLPFFLIWHVAEFFCTVGTYTGHRALEERGKKLIKVMQNFKAIK